MACRGCVNLQCSCFTKNSDSTITVGNGAQYAPFTFRPNYTPFPRPFGHLYGPNDQSLDGAPYSLFETTTPDIDQGGNMNTGNRTSLTATVDGLYLVGVSVTLLAVATDGLNDNFSIRKNSSIQVATTTYAHNATTAAGQILFMTASTLVDLNTGDTIDLFVERVAGAGTVSVEFLQIGVLGVMPHLWAVWMGGPI